MMFVTTASSVALLLMYAVPGFLMIKSKLVDKTSIPAFAKFLLYVCQPCLTFYSFDKADFSPDLLLGLGVFFLIALGAQLGLLLLFYFILRREGAEDVRYRIFNIALVLGNCGFFGIPVVERLFPQRSDAAVYCLVFTLAMNLLCWTLVLYIITRDKQYIKPLRLILNPSTISFVGAFILFVLSVKLPSLLSEAVSLGGKISTPLCMTILGMRLATVKGKELFCHLGHYVVILIKQMAVPAVVLLAVWILPVDDFIRQLSFILFACPVASNVLNFAEIGGQGQATASAVVLLGTLMSIVSMPLMMLLLG
ncbi:MAG: AEC family transporter [Ruminococcus sp.]|nr:AEC family transporter [Ruminococcus sp.]